MEKYIAGEKKRVKSISAGLSNSQDESFDGLYGFQYIIQCQFVGIWSEFYVIHDYKNWGYTKTPIFIIQCA